MTLSPRLLGVVCVLWGAPLLFAASVTFSDGAFNDSDWTATKIQDTTPNSGASFTAGQTASGGNPGSYRRTTHAYDVGAISVAHVRGGVAYDPQAQGPISAIDYSYDLMAQPNQAVTYYLLLVQNGTYYRSSTADNATDSSWRRFNHLGLAAGDFARVAGSGPSTPVFIGPAATPIQVGYISANSAGAIDPGPHSRISGVDNWVVTIYSDLGGVTYADPTFLDQDWSGAKIADTPPGLGATFTAAQQSSGGNPDAFRRVLLNLGAGSVLVAHVRGGVTYNPLIRGPITSIDFSYDLSLRSAPGQPVVYYLLLVQGATYYSSVAADTASGPGWAHFSHTGLAAANFVRVAGLGPPIPSFDALAASIQLGYLTAGSSSSGTVTLDSGIDNWSVRIYPVPSLVLNPGSLALSYQTGGPTPAAQPVSVLSSGPPLNYTVTTSGESWLAVNPGSQTTPSVLNVSLNPAGLAPGNYMGSVTVTVPYGGALNSPQTVAVSLTVTQGSLLQSVSPSTAIAGAGDTVITVTGANFLNSSSVQVNGAALPTNFLSAATLTAVIPAARLATPGVLQITVSGSFGSLPFQVVAPGPTISAAGVVSGASFLPGPIAPGEIVSIFGTLIGPETPAGLEVTAGLVDTMVADTWVLFDEVAAPLIYVQAGQVSAIVPYEVAGKSSVALQIQYRGARSNAVTLAVAPTAPGIFSINASGKGQGAILNQDFTVNAGSNPAPKGSVVAIYATGEGQTTPPGIDGKPASDVLPKPQAPVVVLIGGAQAEVLYAGAAPGLVAGVLQVNARIPQSAPSGPGVPVSLVVGNASSQSGLTLAVQ